jgi:hypothetical protein
VAILRVGIVAEGKSDWLVLEAVMKSVHPDMEFERLRPDMTLASRSPHGWRGVRAWCQENGSRLEVLMRGVLGRPLHLLVVHADCSMAHNESVNLPCPPARATADALREVITRSWLGSESLPRFVILATPSRTVDSWVVAALDPPYEGKVPLECDERVERELVARGLLRAKNGEVKKPEARYGPLVQGMVQKLERVRTSCPEGERFRSEVAAAGAVALPLT